MSRISYVESRGLHCNGNLHTRSKPILYTHGESATSVIYVSNIENMVRLEHQRRSTAFRERATDWSVWSAHINMTEDTGSSDYRKMKRKAAATDLDFEDLSDIPEGRELLKAYLA